MKRISLFPALAFGSLLCLLYVPGGKVVDAAKPMKVLRSCKDCHTDINTVMPKGHPAVSGVDIIACISCHVPDYSGKAESNAYAARLHSAHEGPKARLECLICHNWIPGKSFTVFQQKASFGAPSNEDMELFKKIFTSWVESSYIDSLHSRKNISCSGCHGESLPKEGETVENDRCLLCHGPLDKLQTKTTPKDFPDRNPHKSHLGDIACTVCHHAHGASKVYCLECHKTFKMKIQGEAK